MEVYSASGTKLVTAWRGKGNDAAHVPTELDPTPAEVSLMIEGIRQFIARVP